MIGCSCTAALLPRGPVLAALVAGEAAEAFEQQPAAAAVERVMTVLRGIYEPQGIHVPTPVQVTLATVTIQHGPARQEFLPDVYRQRAIDAPSTLRTTVYGTEGMQTYRLRFIACHAPRAGGVHAMGAGHHGVRVVLEPYGRQRRRR